MDKVEQLAFIKSQITAIKEDYEKQVKDYKKASEHDAIEAEVLEMMLAEGKKRNSTKEGNITVVEYKTYEYPESWKEEVKNFAINKGIIEKSLLMQGKFSVEPSLRLYKVKPKEELLKPKVEKGAIHVG